MHDIKARTIRVIAEMTGIAPQCIEMQHTWAEDLQQDSLACVELALALEEELGIDLDQDEFDKLQTVQQIIDHVASVCTASNEPAPLPFFNHKQSLDALIMAEDFMKGFEDDEAQEGMNDKLAQIRAAIAHEHLQHTKITNLLRAAMACILELDGLKSAHIPLHDTGNGRITELVQAGHDACTAMGYPYINIVEDAPLDIPLFLRRQAM